MSLTDMLFNQFLKMFKLDNLPDMVEYRPEMFEMDFVVRFETCLINCLTTICGQYKKCQKTRALLQRVVEYSELRKMCKESGTTFDNSWMIDLCTSYYKSVSSRNKLMQTKNPKLFSPGGFGPFEEIQLAIKLAKLERRPDALSLIWASLSQMYSLSSIKVVIPDKIIQHIIDHAFADIDKKLIVKRDDVTGRNVKYLQFSSFKTQLKSLYDGMIKMTSFDKEFQEVYQNLDKLLSAYGFDDETLGFFRSFIEQQKNKEDFESQYNLNLFE